VPPLPLAYQPTLLNTLTLADAYPETTATAAIAIPTPTSTSAAYNEYLLGGVKIAQVFVPTPGSSSNSNQYTLFGFWVNGTELAAYTTKNIGLSGKPKGEFPFTRLAGTNVGGQIYLYHQVNGRVLLRMYTMWMVGSSRRLIWNRDIEPGKGRRI